jgi:hypothetical protein
MSRGLQVAIVFLMGACLIFSAMALAEEPTELKAIAKAKDSSHSASIGSFQLNKEGVVIRSVEELVALTRKAKSAKDPEVQKKMTAELAKLLKVDDIDWSKHVVLGVIGQELDSLKIDGKVLTVTFVPFKEPPARSIPATPKILILIERFEGDVKFVKKQ